MHVVTRPIEGETNAGCRRGAGPDRSRRASRRSPRFRRMVTRPLCWRGGNVLKVVAAAAIGTVAFPLMITLFAAAGPLALAGNDGVLGGAPTALARGDIPGNYLAWYVDAARTYPGLPWSMLAGIGEVETDHGRSRLPG